MKEQIIKRLMDSSYEGLSQQLRVLRRYEKAALKMARAKKGTNQGTPSKVWYAQSSEFHRQRQLLSREARYEHLARMFLKGTPYKSVEDYTHPQNTIDIEYLIGVLREWGVKVSMWGVDSWVYPPDSLSYPFPK